MDRNNDENNRWQLQEAKSKFSKLVENAMQNKPQFVTKHGRNAVVILSIEDYERIAKPKTSLVDFLRTSPLAEAEITLSRDKDLPRDIVI